MSWVHHERCRGMSHRIGFIALIVATGLIATGCSQHSSKSSSSVGVPAGSNGTAAGSARQDISGAKALPGAPETAPTTPASPLQQRAVVRTGDVSIEVADVDKAAKSVSDQARKVHGLIADESRSGN